MANPYVINLDSRPDRWESINRDWNGAFSLTKVSAVEVSPGWVGCGLSHVKAVEEAKLRGDPYVLVWEDDCTPYKHSPGQIRYLWNEVLYKLSLHKEKWDIVIGATTIVEHGATYNQTLSTQNVNVYDLPFGFTAHWILYNSSAYDKMIEWKNIKGPEIDVYIYQHFRVKVILPFLAGQAEGYSNIERKILNYNHLFVKAEKKFQLPYKLSVSSLSALIRSGSTRVTTPKFMTR